MRMTWAAIGALALAAAGCSGEPAESRMYRENAMAGNAAMKSGDYAEAIRRYDVAVEHHKKCEEYARDEYSEVRHSYYTDRSNLLTSKAQAQALLGHADEAGNMAFSAVLVDPERAPAVAYYLHGVWAARKGNEDLYRSTLRYLQTRNEPRDREMAAKLQQVGEALLKASKSGKAGGPGAAPPAPPPAPGGGKTTGPR